MCITNTFTQKIKNVTFKNVRGDLFYSMLKTYSSSSTKKSNYSCIKLMHVLLVWKYITVKAYLVQTYLLYTPQLTGPAILETLPARSIHNRQLHLCWLMIAMLVYLLDFQMSVVVSDGWGLTSGSINRSIKRLTRGVNLHCRPS